MEIIINHRSVQPIYEQIVVQIKEMVMSGELKPGDSVTSVRVLAKELKIGALTVQRAYDVLQQDGVIDSVVGKGTFISENSTADIEMQKDMVIEKKAVELIDTAKKYSISANEIIKLIKNLY